MRSRGRAGQAIWNVKPSGIGSFGASAVTITDAAGNLQTVYFDRAQQLTLYVSCTTTPSTLTSDQITAIKTAIAGYTAATFGLGTPVIARSFSASPLEPVSAADATADRPVYVPPVTDVPTFTFDFHATPTNTGNLTVSGLQIATLSTANILVNGS